MQHPHIDLNIKEVHNGIVKSTGVCLMNNNGSREDDWIY
jgi:hypothetical protein